MLCVQLSSVSTWEQLDEFPIHILCLSFRLKYVNVNCTVKWNMCGSLYGNLHFLWDFLWSQWETKSHSAGKEIIQLSRRAHYCIHKGLPFQYASATWIQSISYYPISLSSILMSSSHLCLCIPSGHFSLGFPTKILYKVFILLYKLHAMSSVLLISPH
jgi:hypothetical protein